MNTKRETYLDGIVLLDVWMWEADGPSVVGNDVGNLVCAKHLALNLAEFEVCFLGIDANWSVATLDIVEHAEVLTGLHNLNNVHEAEGIFVVSSGFAVYLNVDILVMTDFFNLLAGKSVF